MNGNGASPDVIYVADWIADSHDAAGADFVIIDKKDARVYVFDGDARLRDSSPVLLGAARGDDSVPDIGSRPLSQVLPAERTTAAGRFVGERGHDTRGDDVVWVDYDAALSMHRVITTNLKERRLERLASATTADNRISYGCINVPVAFYETYLQPTFARQQAIIYVIPEVKSIQQVFGAYDVARVHGVTRNQPKAMSGPESMLLLLLAMRSG
ncbi:MAG: L,D-transpeptidase [Burkholderiales bacterium]